MTTKVKVIRIPGYSQETYDIEAVKSWLFSLSAENSVFVAGKLVPNFEELERLAKEDPEKMLEVLVVAMAEGG